MEKKKFEIRRKIFHIFLGTIIVLLLMFDIFNSWSLFLIIIIGCILSLVSTQIKIPGIYWFIKKFEREDIIDRFPGKGILFFFIGCLLVLRLFDKNIALASIMILALGDSVSSLIGQNFGKHFINSTKTIEGVIVGVIAASWMASFFVSIPQAFFGSLVAMAVEAVELKIGESNVDDNIIIPIVAGTVMFLITKGLF